MAGRLSCSCLLYTSSDTCTVLVSDTVGFISKLPHHLVEAFKATLEELSFADLLLHVIDASNPEWREQAAVVDALIPVSYTHLDVYKRQCLYGAEKGTRPVGLFRSGALRGPASGGKRRAAYGAAVRWARRTAPPRCV